MFTLYTYQKGKTTALKSYQVSMVILGFIINDARARRISHSNINKPSAAACFACRRSAYVANLLTACLKVAILPLARDLILFNGTYTLRLWVLWNGSCSKVSVATKIICYYSNADINRIFCVVQYV